MPPAAREQLFLMLVAVGVFLPVVLAYTALGVPAVLRGRITLEEIRRHAGR